jgi:transposase
LTRRIGVIESGHPRMEAAMGMNKSPIRIILTDEERRELERICRAHTASQREVTRARIVLRLDDGASLSRVAGEVGRQRCVVRKWANRFTRKRLRGLVDAPRSGRPARFSPQSRDPSGEARL